MPQLLNFSERTFLEILSRAAREKVYSAALAWALDDSSGLPLDWRLAIVSALSDADTTGGTSIKATTEWNRVDVLLTIKGGAEDQHVAIENKITAMQGVQQLSVYDEILQKKLRGTLNKVLLTLSAEDPLSGKGWKRVSYSVLHDALCAGPVPDNPYISDLCRALARLVGARDAVCESPQVAAVAFKERNPSNGTEFYIEDMRLNVVLQRIWFLELAKKLHIPKPWQVVINEENASACLDVKAELKDKSGYAVGMQLQNRSLKAYCYPHPYPKEASPDQKLLVEKILLEMRSKVDPNDSQKLSRTKSRGFRSFSFPDVSIMCARIPDDWIEIIAPQLDRLYKTLPSVKPLTPSALPIADSQ